MKKRISIFVMLLVLSGMLFFQSCLDKTPVPFEEYGAFTIPALVAPANGTFLSPAGTTVELKWSSTDLEGDPQKWDVCMLYSQLPMCPMASALEKSFLLSCSSKSISFRS